METVHFHIAHTHFYDNPVSHAMGPNELFGTDEKLSLGTGNLIWMQG